MSPELETLDQLQGGDMPVALVRRLYPSEGEYLKAVLAMIVAGEIRLAVDGADVPHWQRFEILRNPPPGTLLAITEKGCRRMG